MNSEYTARLWSNPTASPLREQVQEAGILAWATQWLRKQPDRSGVEGHTCGVKVCGHWPCTGPGPREIYYPIFLVAWIIDRYRVIAWQDSIQMTTHRGNPYNEPYLVIDGLSFNKEMWHARPHLPALYALVRPESEAGTAYRTCRCYGPSPMAVGTCQGLEGCWEDTVCAVAVAVARRAIKTLGGSE